VVVEVEEQHHHTQLGFARYFAKLYDNRFLYVHDFGWHHWDGTRWARDESGNADRAVHRMFDKMWPDAQGNSDLAKAIIRCETAPRCHRHPEAGQHAVTVRRHRCATSTPTRIC